MLLEYTREFMALASTLNFTETARMLGLTQPTLSRHIAELERDVGCTLLDRSPVRLTKEGAFFLEHISPVIAELDGVLAATRARVSHERHLSLTFALPVSGGRSMQVYSGAAAMLSRHVPVVSFELKEHATKSLVDMLRAGEVDCGYAFAKPEGVESAFIYSTPPVLCVRNTSPLATKRPLHVSDLRYYTLGFSSDKTYEDWQEGQRRVCRVAGFEPRFSLKPSRHIIDIATSLRDDEAILTDEQHVTAASAFPEEVFTVRHFDDDPRIEYVCYLAWSDTADREAVALFVDALRTVAHTKGLNTDEDNVQG